MNVCIFSGRIGSDIVLKKTKDGDSVLDFSLAVRRNKDETDWINCSAYKDKADFIERYFKKGSFIEIRSRLKVTPYEKDGIKRIYHNYQVMEIEFGGAKKEDSSEPKVENNVNEELQFKEPEPIFFNGINPDDLDF